MHRLGVLLVFILFVLFAVADEKQTFGVVFYKSDAGKTPRGWKAEQTGKGEGSVWKVVADDTSPNKLKNGYVLAQTAESPNALFNLCVLSPARNLKDVEVSVAFKAVKGKLDQGGGIVWRYQDANNYYIARMNPLEDNYRFYKVVDGKRMQLGTKEEIKIPAGEWHRLRIKQVGTQIECWLDDKKLLEGKDDTFAKAGNVGLWTKADAQTHFDEFTFTDLGK
jgi:hypothetical protein